LSQSRSPKDYAYLVFTGVAMGAADVVPGVSGGTMAFIMGVYQELIDGIKAFDLGVVKLLLRFELRAAAERVPWRFLVALGSGIGVAILALAGVITWLLAHQPTFLFAFFFGLVLASILAIGVHIRWSPGAVATLAAGTALAYWIVGLVPVETPHDPLTLFLSAMVAISAMILPGISGSFILLILGQYAHVLNAVKTLDVVTLLPFAVGMVVGITGFARILSWLLHHHHQLTITLLVGFMVGSLRKVWPFKETLETGLDRHGDVVPILQRNVLPDAASGAFWLALALRADPAARSAARRAQPVRAHGRARLTILPAIDASDGVDFAEISAGLAIYRSMAIITPCGKSIGKSTAI
jgi:putative membrane protein